MNFQGLNLSPQMMLWIFACVLFAWQAAMTWILLGDKKSETEDRKIGKLAKGLTRVVGRLEVLEGAKASSPSETPASSAPSSPSYVPQGSVSAPAALPVPQALQAQATVPQAQTQGYSYGYGSMAPSYAYAQQGNLALALPAETYAPQVWVAPPQVVPHLQVAPPAPEPAPSYAPHPHSFPPEPSQGYGVEAYFPSQPPAPRAAPAAATQERPEWRSVRPGFSVYGRQGGHH